jgi:hypothetical protein
VPDFPPDLPAETPSGLHRIRVSELNWQGAKLTIAMCVVAVGTAFGAYKFIISEARAQTDAGMKGLESRVVAVEQQVPQLREELHEARQDTHDLYRAIMEGKRSERLERPLPPLPKDGGP